MTITTYANALLAQSDLMLLLADALRPPSRSRERLSEVTPEELAALVRAAALPSPGPQAGPSRVKPRSRIGAQLRSDDALLAALTELLRAAGDIPPEEWSAEHHRLFEGAQPCPLNETAYVRRDKGAILGDVCAFYRAFGWHPAGDTGEKPDHLLCELEFVAMLLVMLAAAEQDGRHEEGDVTRVALNDFADAHLGDWLPSAAARLRECAATQLHERIAAALAALWSALTAVHGWSGPTPTTSLPILEPESPYECIGPGRSPHDPVA